jgi:hypothetical protein
MKSISYKGQIYYEPKDKIQKHDILIRFYKIYVYHDGNKDSVPPTEKEEALILQGNDLNGAEFTSEDDDEALERLSMSCDSTKLDIGELAKIFQQITSQPHKHTYQKYFLAYSLDYDDYKDFHRIVGVREETDEEFAARKSEWEEIIALKQKDKQDKVKNKEAKKEAKKKALEKLSPEERSLFR